MPTSTQVRDQLTDILVAVVDCAPEDVTDDARLDDLGVDSLAAVEVADELGRRFGVHLADEVVDALGTVQQTVDAVLAAPRPDARGRVATTLSVEPPPRRGADLASRADAFWRLALWFVLTGVVIGVVVGFGGATVVRATGLGGVDLPPISATTPEPTPTPSATPTPTPTETAEDAEPQPTFSISTDRVPPGERFSIAGRFPGLGSGEVLQVQFREGEGAWEDFPVSVETREGGTFDTQLYTSRTGPREFRVLHVESDTASPSAPIEIG